MYVLAKSSHSRRELGLVFNDLSGGSVPVDLPAVIEVHILVALRGKTSADDEICRLLDQILRDGAVEPVPGVPAHRRSLSEAVVEAKCE